GAQTGQRLNRVEHIEGWTSDRGSGHGADVRQPLWSPRIVRHGSSLLSLTSPENGLDALESHALNAGVASVEPVLVGLVMGSASDWPVMQNTARQLKDFGVSYEVRALSAHRTPDLLAAWIEDLEARGARCFIAGAGGAAHLAGVVAAKTTLPVLGVPMPSKHLQGLDSLLSIVQMPKGIPVATFAIGDAGAAHAAPFPLPPLPLP